MNNNNDENKPPRKAEEAEENGIITKKLKISTDTSSVIDTVGNTSSSPTRDNSNDENVSVHSNTNKSFAPSITEYLTQVVTTVGNDTTSTAAVTSSTTTMAELKYLPRPEWCGLLGYLMKSHLEDVTHNYDFNAIHAVTMHTDDYNEHLYQVVTNHPLLIKECCWIDHNFSVRVMDTTPNGKSTTYLHSDNDSQYDDSDDEDGDNNMQEDEDDMESEDDEDKAVGVKSKEHDNIIVCTNEDGNKCVIDIVQEKIDFLRTLLRSCILYFDINDYIWKTKRIECREPMDGDNTNTNFDLENQKYQISFETLIQRWRRTKQAIDDIKNTILHLAIEEDAIAVAMDLIRMEINTFRDCERRKEDFKGYGMRLTLLETPNCYGLTPLILAAQEDNVPIAQELLRCDIRMGYSSSHRYTGSAMLQAVKWRSIEVMECILDHYRLTHASVKCLSFDEIVDTPNGTRTTPLMYAAQEGSILAVKLLLKHNASIDRQNEYGMTALMFAAQHGHVEICRLLIGHFADMNLQNTKKSTALSLACFCGMDAVVKELVSAGCELHPSKDSYSETRQMIQFRIQRRLESLYGNGGAGRDEDDDDSDDDEIYKISSLCDERILRLLHPQTQVQLMQCSMRAQRNFEIIRIHTLLQDHRANISMKDGRSCDVSTILHILTTSKVSTILSNSKMREMMSKLTTDSDWPRQKPPQQKLPPPLQLLLYNRQSTKMLLRTMLLPAPLVKNIALFLPLPNLWHHHMNRLELGDANEKIIYALDIMDEILESGGFLSACDTAKIPAPSPHTSWCDWKRCANTQNAWDANIDCGNSDVMFNCMFTQHRRAVIACKPPSPQDDKNPTIRELRRLVGYTSLLRQYQSQTNIVTILSEKPYEIPLSIINRLIQLDDIASISRRCGMGPFLPSCRDANYNADICFEHNALLDVAELLRELHLWHHKQCFRKNA